MTELPESQSKSRTSTALSSEAASEGISTEMGDVCASSVGIKVSGEDGRGDWLALGEAVESVAVGLVSSWGTSMGTA